MHQPSHPATPQATHFAARFGTRGPLTAVATLALLGTVAAAPAQAAESTLSPYFHTLLLGGVSRAGNGSFAFDDIYLTDHRSNSGPLSQSNGRTVSADGAVYQGVGQSTYSGFFASRNYASMRVTNAQGPHTYYTVSGQGAATGVRFFTAEAAAANAVFTWRVTGNASNPSTSGRAEARLDFGTKVGSAGDFNDLFADPAALNAITRFGPGTYTYNLPVADLGEAIYLYFWSSAFTAANTGQFTPGSSFDLTANFASTYVLEDVDLYDTSGNLLSDWTLAALDTQETLFDQNGRVAPIEAAPRLPDLPPLGVSAPGSLALALLGLVLLGRRRRDMPATLQRAGASSSATARKASSAACRFSTISAAITSGAGRLSTSSRLSSLSAAPVRADLGQPECGRHGAHRGPGPARHPARRGEPAATGRVVGLARGAGQVADGVVRPAV